MNGDKIMEKYITIIGDLINSKQIKNRNIFQDELNQIFSKINKKYKNSIVSNFTITVGDEFQAILFPGADLLKILDELYITISYNFRLGIGYGEITTKINPKLSIGADGNAFWNAREAIEYIYTNNYKDKCNIYFISKNEYDSSINTLFLLTETLKKQWTKLQKETFSKMITNNIYNEEFNQQEFANKIGITESSLSKRLTLSNIKIYLKGRKEISKIMEKIYE